MILFFTNYKQHAKLPIALPAVQQKPMLFIPDNSIEELISLSSLNSLQLVDEPFANSDSIIPTSVPKLSSPVSVICTKHNKEWSMYCEDEDEFGCIECDYTAHKNHKTVAIQVIQSNIQQSIPMLNNAITVVGKKLETSQMNASHASELMKQKAAVTSKTFAQCTTALAKQLQNILNNPSDKQLHQSVCEKQSHYIKIASQLLHLQDKLQNASNIVEKFRIVAEMKKLQDEVKDMVTISAITETISTNLSELYDVIERLKYVPVLQESVAKAPQLPQTVVPAVIAKLVNKSSRPCSTVLAAGAAAPLSQSMHVLKYSKINLPNVVQITSTEYSIIALTSDGKVFGRGSNTYGELSLGHKNGITTWTHINSFNCKVVSVQCGHAHALFLTENYQVYTCGYNNYGQLVFLLFCSFL